MSALPDSLPVMRPMLLRDVERVMAIEPKIYPHPWTRGNFRDSLNAGYSCWVMECGGFLAGYGVLMLAPDEAHLLNLSVAPEWQRQGLGRKLLQHFIKIARENRACFLYLEVRPSNVAARALYAASGFREISLRRGYYPATGGREDAIFMGLAL